MKFNINEYVRVKLTEHGKEIHKGWRTSPPFENAVYVPPVEDAEGWSRWPLWHLMQIFGKHLHMGCNNPFETEIEIVDQ